MIFTIIVDIFQFSMAISCILKSKVLSHIGYFCNLVNYITIPVLLTNLYSMEPCLRTMEDAKTDCKDLVLYHQRYPF